MASPLDAELIRRMLDAQANPVEPFDPTKITSAVGTGLDLANTIQTRKQSQEDRVKKLADEIQKAKRQKILAAEAAKAAPVANISPDLAEAATLESPAEASKQITERLFALPKAEPRAPRALGLQSKGRLKTGQIVSYDPSLGYDVVAGPKGSVPYDLKRHGETQPLTNPALDAGQMKDISQIRDSITQLKTVKENYRPAFVGPIEGRLLKIYNATGINLTNVDPSDSTKFRIGATTALNDYIRSVTGAQLSQNEQARIEAAMASVTGPDATFIPAIEEAIRLAEAKVNGRLADYEAAGYRNIGDLRESRNTGNPGQTGGLSPEKAARKAELLAKKAAGTLR